MPETRRDLGQRGLGADRAPVGVARGHHVVGVGDGDDAGAERDLLARDAGRVAAAGELLVVVQDDLGDRAVALDALDELGALLGVELDQLPLVVGQLAVGEEDVVGEDELADVVQQRGGVDQVLLALVAARARDATSRE